MQSNPEQNIVSLFTNVTVCTGGARSAHVQAAVSPATSGTNCKRSKSGTKSIHSSFSIRDTAMERREFWQSSILRIEHGNVTRNGKMTHRDRSGLEQAPAFLQDELEPHYEALGEIQQRRLDWYTDHIPRNLNEILGTVESLCAENSLNNVFADANTYRGVILVPDETDPEGYAADRHLHLTDVITEAELDDYRSPSEYGIDLPAPILTGEYKTNSWYSMIPWSDGLVCGCPYKQRRPCA
jgi:hypothetical protein